MIIGRGSLFARMCRSVQTVPVVPLFYGWRQRLQIVWIDDMCAAIANGIDSGLAGAYGVAAPDGIDIRRFYREIAGLAGRSCRFVHLPGPPMVAALRLPERIGLPLPITSENVLGLKHMRLWPLEDALRTLGITPLDFTASLARLAESEPGSSPTNR